MPVFAYFAVMAPVLLGLLCLVEAVTGPPGPMPLASSATGLPVAYVAPKANPVLTVREGIVAEIPKSQKGEESYALSSASSAPAATPAKQPVKTKVAKASKKKAPQQQEFAQFGWQQNQSFNGGWEQRQNRGGWEQQRNGWDQQQKRSSRNANNRNGSGGRYAMSGQQNFFSPFGTIR